MQTKLTLRLESALIRRAKEHAKRTGKSLSVLVADYFAALDIAGKRTVPATPKVRSLVGAFGKKKLDEDDYHNYLEEKHS